MALAWLPPAFALLRKHRNVAVDAALAEALPHFEPHLQAGALDLLIERAHPVSLAAVVGRFDEFDETLQAKISQRVDGLHTAIRRAITASKYEERAGAISLIVSAGCGRLAWLLSDALRLRCRKTRERAAAGLHQLAGNLLEQREQPATPAEQARLAGHLEGLAEALAKAVDRWEAHLQPRVLEAATWFTNRVGPAIRRKLDQPRGRANRVFAEMLATTGDARSAAFAIWSLGHPALRAAAARTIARAADSSLRRAILDHVWMLADPAIEQGARWVRESDWLHDGLEQIMTADAARAEHAMRWMSATCGMPERRVELLLAIIKHGSPELRRSAFWRLAADDSAPATELLRSLALRKGDELAILADREIRRRFPSAAPTLAHSTTRALEPPAPEDQHRQLIEDQTHTTATTPPHPAPAPKPAAASLAPVRALLNSSEPLDRARGLRAAAEAGLVDRVSQDVLRLTQDPIAIVRAQAVALLADMPDATAVRLLRLAARDPDPRVQANAIEGLDRRDVSDRARVTRPGLDSQHNRVRANAVKSLLRLEVQHAAEALLEMLTTPDADHRLSGLWVVERLELRSLLMRVAELSQRDSDARVRARAGRLLRELRGRSATPPPTATVKPVAPLAAANPRQSS